MNQGLHRQPSAGQWHGRQVLITGHTGFKGGWLALWLAHYGAEVHGLSLPAETPSFYQVCRLRQRLRSHHEIDLRDADAVRDILRRVKPEVVFHLAAQPLVRRSYQEPLQTLATNVMGTAHLLDAIRTTGSVKALVVVTTDKVYLNREWLWPYREDEPLGGHDPYSSSKACCELLVASWRDSFLRAAGVGTASARAGNVIGGGDWSADRLLPDLLRAAESGHSVAIRSPAAVRPWQHVLEPLSGYLLLAQTLLAGHDDAASAWNFGPFEDDAQSVGWIVDRMREALPTLQVEYASGPQPHEAGQLRLDSHRARERLGWRPRWRLAEALHHTLDWNRAWRQGEDMAAFSLAQIGAYLQSHTT